MINIQVLTDDFGGRDDVAFLKKINGMSLEELLPVLETAKKDLKWLYNNSRGKGVMLLFMKKDALWVRQRVKWLEETIKKKTNVVKENIMKKSQLKQLIKEVINETGERKEFRVNIKLGNEAASTNEDIVNMLQQVIKKLNSGLDVGTIVDINGNYVGKFEIWD